MARQEPVEVIKRYIEDAIAAEHSFESQLRAVAAETKDQQVQQMCLQHAEETKWQYQQLGTRLEALGGRPPGLQTLKGFIGHLIGFGPKIAQIGHDESERTAQDLMALYAVENSEVAMYESLAVAADAAGDTETETLARAIQQQERQTAEKVWALIAPNAREAYLRVTGTTG